jgi:ribosomal protein S18 acetylase RimI-like enzyme
LILADSSRARIYVARAGERIVAMAALHFTISTAEGGKVAGLEDCIVHPDYREQGIGKALLAYVLGQARAEGALRVMLLTDGDNARAQALYRKLGFAPSSMLAMRLKL